MVGDGRVNAGIVETDHLASRSSYRRRHFCRAALMAMAGSVREGFKSPVDDATSSSFPSTRSFLIGLMGQDGNAAGDMLHAEMYVSKSPFPSMVI